MGTWLGMLKKAEEEILKSLKIEARVPFKMIIAIGGFSGVGKDTAAGNIQNHLLEGTGKEYKITVAGEITRSVARTEGYHEKDMDLFMQKAEDSQEFAQQIDYAIEKETFRKSLTKGGIFVGRMAPFTIGDWGVSIWMKAQPEIIAERLINDPQRSEYSLPYPQVLEKIQVRDQTDHNRLEKVYGISFKDMIRKVDIVLDTSFLSINTTAEILFKALSSKLKHFGLI